MAVVHVVDDDDSMRASLVRLLRANGLEAVGYSSGGEFLLQRPNSPGCLLLDVWMPGPSGLDLQVALTEQGINLPIVFMTGRGDVASCAKALKGGAVDFLEKPIDPDRLLDAVRRALQRDLTERTAKLIRDELISGFAKLSPRERQVFEMVVTGKLNKHIADELRVSERTVKALRATLMEKLGTGSAAVLGRIAERLAAIK